ncbi:phage holin family protein [Cyclobacterium marinum]|uniref:Holin n=1 Tax=Cyclobacterium marinum (strain ATCC 25205 / DSM 745 / LMG 13164 / NCIMB 1802) TaxID=880070 RepID=G0IZ72_CYCMS|nr:phage holin family protein [Cyclobacterium marinum]AEL23851.1 hypothetical protein Cycma_0066 [Cyclobacterium marinum DSM 745]
MNCIEKILATYGYDGWGDLWVSLSPSFKYAGVTAFTMGISSLGVSVLRIFGLDSLAFAGLLIVFGFELVTGLARANAVKERITSVKFSRFLFKVFYYLISIAVTYLMSMSFLEQGKPTAALIFDWMHMFLVIQIVLENIVSISENLAVVQGKEKSHFVTVLQEKINQLLR